MQIEDVQKVRRRGDIENVRFTVVRIRRQNLKLGYFRVIAL